MKSLSLVVARDFYCYILLQVGGRLAGKTGYSNSYATGGNLLS